MVMMQSDLGIENGRERVVFVPRPYTSMHTITLRRVRAEACAPLRHNNEVTCSWSFRTETLRRRFNRVPNPKLMVELASHFSPSI